VNPVEHDILQSTREKGKEYAASVSTGQIRKTPVNSVKKKHLGRGHPENPARGNNISRHRPASKPVSRRGKKIKPYLWSSETEARGVGGKEGWKFGR